MQDWQQKNIEDAARRASRVEIEFDRFPPRTLIHGYFKKSDSFVHIYTDNAGVVNALTYKIGLGDHKPQVVNESTPGFDLKDHLPDVSYTELSDYRFLMDVISKFGLSKLDNTHFNKLAGLNQEYKTKYFKHPMNSTITGPTSENVFSKPLHLEQGAVLKNKNLELKHGSLVDQRAIAEFNHGISQTIMLSLGNEDRDIMRNSMQLIVGHFNQINDNDLQHMAHIVKEYIDLARLATSIHPKAWDEEQQKSIKP